MYRNRLTKHICFSKDFQIPIKNNYFFLLQYVLLFFLLHLQKVHNQEFEMILIHPNDVKHVSITEKTM